MPDTQAAHELKLYIDNDGSLYRAMTTSILKNLVAKKARGQYKHDLAVKGFGYLTEAGAKKYAQEFGTGPWHKMFDVSTRKQVAEKLTRDFEEVFAEGNYDRLLPKKYQKAGSSGHARKKSGLGAWPMKYDPPRPSTSTGTRAGRLKGTEARRSAISVAREQSPFAFTAQAAQDIREFSNFLRSATDRQVQGIFDKEKWAGRDEYAALAMEEAQRRGIELVRDNAHGRNDHARSKQIAREILQVVPSYRGR
jgi:hypothetical protein